MDLRHIQTGIVGNRVARLELRGEYDLTNRDDIASLFRALRADGPAVIDMAKVTYIDSTVLHQLVELRSRFKDHLVTLLVNKHMRRIFRIVNFDGLFEIVEARATDEDADLLTMP